MTLGTRSTGHTAYGLARALATRWWSSGRSAIVRAAEKLVDLATERISLDQFLQPHGVPERGMAG